MGDPSGFHGTVARNPLGHANTVRDRQIAVDFARRYRLHHALGFFVTRAKRNFRYYYLDSCPADRTTGVHSDQIIRLPALTSAHLDTCRWQEGELFCRGIKQQVRSRAFYSKPRPVLFLSGGPPCRYRGLGTRRRKSVSVKHRPGTGFLLAAPPRRESVSRSSP